MLKDKKQLRRRQAQDVETRIWHWNGFDRVPWENLKEEFNRVEKNVNKWVYNGTGKVD